MRVETCYLHPVKGMTPAEVETLELEPGLSPSGDRGFVFAFADAEKQGPAGWVRKHDAITSLASHSLSLPIPVENRRL